MCHALKCLVDGAPCRWWRAWPRPCMCCSCRRAPASRRFGEPSSVRRCCCELLCMACMLCGNHFACAAEHMQTCTCRNGAHTHEQLPPCVQPAHPFLLMPALSDTLTSVLTMLPVPVMVEGMTTPSSAWQRCGSVTRQLGPAQGLPFVFVQGKLGLCVELAMDRAMKPAYIMAQYILNAGSNMSRSLSCLPVLPSPFQAYHLPVLFSPLLPPTPRPFRLSGILPSDQWQGQPGRRGRMRYGDG